MSHSFSPERRRLLRGTVATALAGIAARLTGSAGVALSMESRPVFGPKELDIQFRWKKLLCLHTFLRALAEKNAPAPEAFAEAVETYRKQRKLIPDPRIWMMLESYVAPADDLSQVAGQLAVFAKEYRTDNLAPTGREISAAISRSLPAFEASVWPGLQERKRTDIDSTLERRFRPGRERLLDFLFTSLNARPLQVPRLEIHLVGTYSLRGHDTRDIHGQYFSILESERFPGLDLLESVVWLIGRVLELEGQENPKAALSLIRRKQQPLRLPNDALLPQAILYWTAGEAVKRIIDPAHEHIGARNARLYSGALRPFMPALREVWNPYLDGKFGLDEATDRLIERVRVA